MLWETILLAAVLFGALSVVLLERQSMAQGSQLTVMPEPRH